MSDMELLIREIETEDDARHGWQFALALVFGIVGVVLFSGCAALKSYQSTVSERSDSLSGYAKDETEGIAFTHTVRYK